MSVRHTPNVGDLLSPFNIYLTFRGEKLLLNVLLLHGKHLSELLKPCTGPTPLILQHFQAWLLLTLGPKPPFPSC